MGGQNGSTNADHGAHSIDFSALETQLFINGDFVDASNGKTFETINPANENVLCSVANATESDVNRAVAAAVTAFKPTSDWRKLSAYERSVLIHKIADGIESRADFFAELETLDNGKPLSRCGTRYGSTMDVSLAVKCFRYYAGWCDKICGQTVPVEGGMMCLTLREPVGVCGQIIPWNFPLLMAAWKIAPAIATGCTVVLKSSEKTPLSALQLGRVIKDAGVPNGVVNILSGDGSVGEFIARHPDVRKVSFTGSTAVGHKIQKMAAETNLKRVSLELGGKSPLIVCPGVDVDEAVKIASMALFLNHGQCCAAGSRLFVHESIYDEFAKKCAERANQIKVDHGLNSGVDQGPQVDKLQFDRVMSYIDAGKKEGARLLTGGARHSDQGYFIQPTVFADVTDDMKIAKEEIFGPVQSILKWKDVDEVIERANATIYGLASGVVCKDLAMSMKLAKGIEAGTVWVNCYNFFDHAAPFGGYKESGHGRDKGYEALENFLETKTVIFPVQ